MKTFAIILLLAISQSAYSMGKHRSSSAGGTNVNYRLYTIKKGDHYAHGDRLDLPRTKSTLSYSVLFDESVKYTNVNPVNQQDINKLVGFADCGGLQIHKNSARFGFRWFQGAVQIFAYTYADSVRASQYLGDAQIGNPGNYSIRVDGSQYVFNFNGRETKMHRGCHKNNALKMRSYPYFGGDETSPQKMSILVKHL